MTSAKDDWRGGGDTTANVSSRVGLAFLLETNVLHLGRRRVRVTKHVSKRVVVRQQDFRRRVRGNSGTQGRRQVPEPL